MRRRRSEEPPDRRLDLHGYGVQRALARLVQELHACRLRGVERLLVITGRGWGTRTGTGVLTPVVRAWLEGPEGRRHGVRRVQPSAKGGALLVELEPPRGRLGPGPGADRGDGP